MIVQEEVPVRAADIEHRRISNALLEQGNQGRRGRTELDLRHGRRHPSGYQCYDECQLNVSSYLTTIRRGWEGDDRGRRMSGMDHVAIRLSDGVTIAVSPSLNSISTYVL